ncbi:FAD-binding oxidoreductase [Mitsuaria sp. GD03876]|uniref:NAD(P)/FAD-dependent oxidoreductase n=1 Tax=Mitsuaria sp. GD03876 TaxID=2975399 RepID=UPI00244BAC4F|nr:FAD-binding oxidoreductase [Mitsuaria sp. GD03876]MDH0863861.1 FAD-binding oxidoreductase [Mitsuaria sp. GD03876]
MAANYLQEDAALARDSYYVATAERTERHAPLQGDASCDVAIVGGGLAGLSAALELAGRGFDVRVLEAREVGGGASGRNGGQVIHGLACDPAVIEQQLGATAARQVWGMSIEAIDLIRDRCARFDIDAEWQSGFLGVACNARKARELLEGADFVEGRYGYPMARIEGAEVRRWVDSPRYVAAVHDPRSGHLHPLKYVLGLARAAASLGVRLHEQSPVLRLQAGARPVLHTAQGSLRARQVLLAGNVYLQDIAPQLEARIMPVGTYIVATEPLPAAQLERLIPSRSAVCDNNAILDYYRPSRDGRMIFGGRASYSTRTPSDLSESMRARMTQVFPQLAEARVAHTWGGFVDVTMNRAPDFGRLPARQGQAANVYYLQGFSGHGLALTGLAGRLVAEAIAGDAGRFDTFAALRHRPFPGGRWLRTPALVAGMAYYRLKDLL